MASSLPSKRARTPRRSSPESRRGSRRCRPSWRPTRPSPTSPNATSASMSRCTASRPPSRTIGSCCASTSCRPSESASSLTSSTKTFWPFTTSCTTCPRSRTERSIFWSRCSTWPTRGAGVPPAPTRAGAWSRFKVEKHERFLTREELYRLGQALRAAPAERLASTHAAAAIRLLVLTGCRRNEILGLRWDDLNFDTGEMRLRDSKTGARMVPLPPKSHSIVHTPYRLSVALAPFGMRPRLLHQPPRPQSHAAVCGPLRRNAFRVCWWLRKSAAKWRTAICACSDHR